MSMFNGFLQSLSEGQASILYYVFVGLGILSYIPYFYFIAKQIDTSRRERNILLIVYPILCALVPLISVGSENGGVCFRSTGSGVLSGFLFGGSIAYLLGVSVNRCWNVIMPLIIGSRSILAIGCTFSGCCHGIPVKWGIYSRIAETTVFPCNQIESLLGILMCIICLGYLKKSCFSSTSQIGAAVLIPFGIMRFFSDMYRDNRKIFATLSFDGCVAIAMVVLGILALNFWKDSHFLRDSDR